MLGASGTLLREATVTHEGRALQEFASWLAGRAEDPACIAVAIETPHGTLVDELLARGCSVFHLNPKQLDRFRDRLFPAGAKDDRRDAYVLASALRTDLAAFRPLDIEQPLMIELRETGRLDEQIGGDFVAWCSRLWELLRRSWPALLELSPAADEPWLWALLERAPSPGQARRLRRATIGALLRKHQIRRLTADQVYKALQQPPVYLAPGVGEATTYQISAALSIIRTLYLRRQQSERHLQTLLARLTAEPAAEASDEEHQQHRDAVILLSLPGVGTRIGATMLGEAARALATRDYHRLRSVCGVAPVTRQSGRQRRVVMRRAVNKRLRNATHHWGGCIIQRDEAARSYYAALRDRGHRHAHALRCLADRMLKVLVAMLRDGTTYDASRRNRRVASAA